ncbi:hypothetical protein AGMMS49991_10110 [Spirochaetia bacterium]|nr:hypothetical protein AGMMS49991_10110 [Spirochaetia bacterium]
MTNRKNLIFALLAAFLFASCVVEESIGVTVIEISNNSSHDLHVSFEPADYIRLELDDVDINKNQSCSVEKIKEMTDIARDPNFSLKFVIFSSRDDSGMSVEKPAEGLFIFKSREKYTEGGEKVVYLLTITDAMLEP